MNKTEMQYRRQNKRRFYQEVTCKECEGIGLVEDSEYNLLTEDCPACRGKGYVIDEHVDVGGQILRVMQEQI